jgi:adenine phosphoribosyltransferase
MQSSHNYRYLLTSESSIKTKVVRKCINFNNLRNLRCKSFEPIPNNVEQPVGLGGLFCCKNRIKMSLFSGESKKNNAIISIENSIEKIVNESCNIYVDVVHVLIYDTSKCVYYYERGRPVPFDEKYWQAAYEKSSERTEIGWNYTVGEVMRDFGVASNHKNWMKSVAGRDRADQITEVFKKCWERYQMESLDERDILGNVDFYLGFKKGVLFQDMGSIMSNRVLFDILMFKSEKVLRPLGMNMVDYVVGIGARGFYLGPLLAERFGCGFVPIRKKGKLPGATLGVEYGTEYSLDEMEVQIDLIRDNSTVLVVDDLVATGGSLEAACILIKQKAEVIGCFCPLKVDELVEVAREKLEKMKIKLVTL